MAADIGLRLPSLIADLIAEDEQLAVSLRRLGLDAPTIETAAANRLDALTTAVTAELEAVADAGAQLEQAKERELHPERRFGWLTGPGPYWVAVALAVLAIGSFVGSRVWTLSGAPILRTTAPLIALALALLLVFATQLMLRLNWRRLRRVERWNESLHLDALETQYALANRALDLAVTERGLLPLVLGLRDERDNIAYSTELTYVTARGLSQVYDADMFEVETGTVQRIRDFLDGTPGGSLGLAGPRGTGKTTAMASFVSGRSRRSDGMRGRAISVSAPVEYVPRDFILHLFAELCRSVLVPDPIPTGRPDGSMLDDLGITPSWRTRRLVATLIATTSLLAGAALIAASRGWFSFDPRLFWGAVLVIFSPVSLILFSLFERSRVDRRRHVIEEREYERYLAARQGKAREGVSDELAGLAASYLDVIRFQQTFTSGWSGSVKAGISIVEASAGLTGGSSTTRHSLSLPEISTMFAQFTLGLTELGPVIIGIDELDKIQSAERAQAFLNDIKSVFGLNGCYFLISVSEDALANFERRGLPVRDAFDSALDDVVHFEPLTYQTTLRLIRGRVVGLPDPFVAVAHCLGGGLPRDVIRWTRALVDAEGEGAGNDITTLLQSVIQADLTRKLAATTALLARKPSEQGIRAIRTLSALKLEPSSDALLRAYQAYQQGHRREESSTAELASPGPPGQQEDVDLECQRAVDGFFTYVYFCATLIGAFTSSTRESAFRARASSSGSGSVDALARARNLFGVDPWLAARAIDSFRQTSLGRDSA